MLLSLVLVAGASAAAEPVTIGVLAQGPSESVAARWASTAQYLHERIPSRDFVIRPLTAATAPGSGGTSNRSTSSCSIP